MTINALSWETLPANRFQLVERSLIVRQASGSDYLHVSRPPNPYHQSTHPFAHVPARAHAVLELLLDIVDWSSEDRHDHVTLVWPWCHTNTLILLLTWELPSVMKKCNIHKDHYLSCSNWLHQQKKRNTCSNSRRIYLILYTYAVKYFPLCTIQRGFFGEVVWKCNYTKDDFAYIYIYIYIKGIYIYIYIYTYMFGIYHELKTANLA